MPDGYVTVATLSTPLEADLSRLRLEAEDIPVCILDGHLGSMNPIYGIAAGVRLQVPAEFANQAADVLRSAPEVEMPGDEIFGDDDDDADQNDFDTYQAQCPQCASKKIGRYNLWLSAIGAILSTLFFAVIIRKAPRVKYSWYCKLCGELWRAPQKSAD